MKSAKTFLLAAALVMAQNLVQAADAKTPQSSKGVKSEDNERSRVPRLAPGKWAPVFEMGEVLFPSVVVGTATIKTCDGDDSDPLRLSDEWGVVGVAVKAPSDNYPLTIKIFSDKFISPSSFSIDLPKSGKTYRVFPPLKYNYDKLLQVKQTEPENLTFVVSAGGAPPVEIMKRIQVRPVNDCVYSFDNCLGEQIDTGWLFAAYVNENHPVISDILKDALSHGRSASFGGYQGDTEDVLNEIGAIWYTLKKRGMRYSSINTTSGADDIIGCQHVRLLGESITSTQANCVDGSVLLASIFRKIGLEVALILLDDHMLLAVNLDRDGENTAFIETTMLSEGSLSDAIESGLETFNKHEERFKSDKDEDKEFQIISITEARRIGIMPLKDAGMR